MSADFAAEAAAHRAPEPRRLPVALSLAVAASASLALWSVIAIGVKALLA